VLDNLTLDLGDGSGEWSRWGRIRVLASDRNLAIASHCSEGMRGRVVLRRGCWCDRSRENDRKFGCRRRNLLQDLGAGADATAKVEISWTLEANKLLPSKQYIAQALSNAGSDVQS